MVKLLTVFRLFVIVHCVFTVIHNDNQVYGISDVIGCRMAKYPFDNFVYLIIYPFYDEEEWL